MGQELTKDGGKCKENGLLFCCTPKEPPDSTNMSQLQAGDAQPYPQSVSTAAEGLARSPAAAAASTASSISWDLICSDLEGSEQIVYGDAFTSFGGSGQSPLAMDCEPMRDFIVEHSALGMDDLDPALFQVAPEFSVSLEGFLQLLREHSNNDGQSLEHFVSMSSNGETLTSEEARSGLLLLSQQHLEAEFSDSRWDSIFNSVMRDTGVSVDMEQWLICCKRVARIVRLARLALVSDCP